MGSLRYLNKFFLRYKWRFLLGILFVTVSNLFGILPAQLIRNALNVVADNIQVYRQFHGFESQHEVDKLISSSIFIFGLLVLLMALLKGIFMFFMRQTIIVMSRLIEYDMKNEIFQHYQVLDSSFYSHNNTGDLMNRISEDVSRVRMYLGPAIMYTINLVVMFILVIAAMISVNTTLTLYVLIPLPILVFVVYYVHDIINKRSEQVQEKLSDMSTFVQESFSGIRVLKAYAREEKYLQAFVDQSISYKNISMDLVKVNALFFPSMLVLIGLSSLITIYVGGLEVIKGNLTFGNIAEFIIYVNMLTWPVASLGWTVSLVQRAAASQERINEFMFTKPAIVSDESVAQEIKGDIVFKNVTYTYGESLQPVLKNVSFHVPAGNSLAVIGRTGSGKTTLANLLLRMMDVTEGSILIDGTDIRHHNLNHIRSQTGYVPQDVFLFSDTIANNIAFGLKNDSGEDHQQRIYQAAKDAAIYDNIAGFRQGFETMVGERGITLSGGQKQRISIARAIIKQPKILIFDDCLSAVDTKTEEEILTNLQRIMANRTTIIIGHRVSSVKHASSIIVLDEGAVIEQGTHTELMALKGAYAAMYEKQLLEERNESGVSQ